MPKIAMKPAPRSERLAVLVTVRTKSELDKVAMIQRESINGIINIAVCEYLEKHRGDIDLYDRIFGEE